MNADQKIHKILTIIKDRSQLTPHDEFVAVNEEKLQQAARMDSNELATALRLVQNDLKCIKIMGWPEKQPLSPDQIDIIIRTNLDRFTEADFAVNNTYKLVLLPSFNKAYTRYARQAGQLSSTPKPRPPKIVITAGKFSVDSEGFILHGKVRIELEPKQQQMAKLLLQKSPATATFDELIEAMWDDTKEHEADYLDIKSRRQLTANIHDCASKLRKILTSYDQRDHIKNIPRTGYKFLA